MSLAYLQQKQEINIDTKKYTESKTISISQQHYGRDLLLKISEAKQQYGWPSFMPIVAIDDVLGGIPVYYDIHNDRLFYLNNKEAVNNPLLVGFSYDTSKVHLRNGSFFIVNNTFLYEPGYYDMEKHISMNAITGEHRYAVKPTMTTMPDPIVIHIPGLDMTHTVLLSAKTIVGSKNKWLITYQDNRLPGVIKQLTLTLPIDIRKLPTQALKVSSNQVVAFDAYAYRQASGQLLQPALPRLTRQFHIDTVIPVLNIPNHANTLVTAHYDPKNKHLYYLNIADASN